MARSSPNPQLIRLVEVADVLGVLPEQIKGLAAKSIVAFWDDSLAVPIDVAHQIFQRVREEQAESDRQYFERLAREEQEIQEMLAKSQARAAAEQDRASQNRRIAGVRVSLPGEPAPSWAED